MGRLSRFAEFAFTVIALFILSGAVLLLVLSGGANEEDVGATYDTSLYQLCFLAIFGVSSLLLACRWEKSLKAMGDGVFVLSFIMLAVSSVLWSSAPDETLRSSISLTGSSLFGLYLGTRYNLKQLVSILGWVFSVSIILSFLFAILLPKYGLMGGVHTGVWRGIYMHKNSLGIRMVNSIVIFLILIFENRQYKWIPYLGITLSIVLLLFSRSTSSLINTVFVLTAFLILQTVRWNYRLMVLALTILTLLSSTLTAWLVINAGSIFGSLGKDLTLSGRTVLWSAAWEMIQRKPWFGYGYDGFWHGMDGESAYIWLATGWKMNHPHNGFIGALLDLGFIGLLLFLISFTQNLYRSLLLLRMSYTATAFYPILSLLFLIASNFTETSLPFTSDLGCALYVFLSLVLVRELREARSSKLNAFKLDYSSG